MSKEWLLKKGEEGNRITSMEAETLGKSSIPRGQMTIQGEGVSINTLGDESRKRYVSSRH